MPSGVKQGDVLSPALFAVFINDLAREVEQLGEGVLCDHVLTYIFLNADYIILLSKNEEDLQKNADVLLKGAKEVDCII